jgi:alkylhydroperoxidase family enzyme
VQQENGMIGEVSRFPLIPEDEWDETIRPIGEKQRSHFLGVVNLHRVLANSPKAFRRYLSFAAYTLNSHLAARDRELLILRVAWLRRIPYEWAHHAAVGKSVGLTELDIGAVQEGGDAAQWTRAESALIEAADQLIATSFLDDDLWSRLALSFNQAQIIDIILTVGNYVALGMVLNALKVPIDEQLHRDEPFSASI